MKIEELSKKYRGQFSDSFLRAMEFVLPTECVFARGHYGDYDYLIVEDDPADPGGRTFAGIDQRSHPSVDVDKLTFADALRIYHEGEWKAVRGDDLPASLALVLFDSAVNVGTSRVVKWLQAAVGAEADGKMGPKTLEAVRLSDLPATIGSVLQARQMYYESLPARLTRRFLKGWTNRVAQLAKASQAQNVSAIA